MNTRSKTSRYSSRMRCRRKASVIALAAFIGLLAACASVGASPSRHKPRSTTTTAATTTTTVAPTTTTVAPTTTTAPSNVLFEDDFNGTTIDTSKWFIKNDGSGGYNTGAFWGEPKATNAFLDGQGDLVLRTDQEPWLNEPYAGALISTFNLGSGWPPTSVKATFAPPYHVEARIRFTNEPAGHATLWQLSTDRTQGNVYEIDVAEMRTTEPAAVGCHLHPGSGTVWNCGQTVSDTSQNWHVFSADVFTDHVNFYVDGVLSDNGDAPIAVPGHEGLILSHVINAPGTWGADGAIPTGTGPWDMLVDYVKVTAL